jgi:DNA-binding CsgD family transcriptional regulator
MTSFELAVSFKKRSFSKSVLASADWHGGLARLCGGCFTAAMTIGFADEIATRLNADSILILHYPTGTSPQLLYGRTDDKHRANKVDDYLSGHYALDPFYVRRDYCSSQEMASLREVIEEDFASSEYYKVHYRSAGLIDELCFCSGDGEGGHLNFSLGRTIGKNHFTAAEIEAARAIAPLVNAALRTTWRALASGSPSPRADTHDAHHRHIENTRLNFGRSVLTDREFEILQHLLHGKSVHFIARLLAIAVSTVKVHRKHIYSKLNINSQAEIFTLFLEVAGQTRPAIGCDPLAQYHRSKR